MKKKKVVLTWLVRAAACATATPRSDSPAATWLRKVDVRLPGPVSVTSAGWPLRCQEARWHLRDAVAVSRVLISLSQTLLRWGGGRRRR